MSRVLLVDDDPGVLETFGAILRHAGHEVLTAPSGTIALDLVERHSPDLLLLDFKLPDLSGLEVLAYVRHHGTTVPAVLITGHPSLETSVEAMRLGAVDYLVKPVFEEDLVAALERWLGERTSCQNVLVADRRGGEEAATDHAESPPPNVGPDESIGRADGLAVWADAMTQAVHAPQDLRTTTEWAAVIGVAPATLRGWCRVADLRVKESLDLARVLRAVSYARRLGSVVGRFLNVLDHHTLERLLAAAGIGGSLEVPTVEEVLRRQTLVRDPVAVKTLRDLIVKPGGTPESS